MFDESITTHSGEDNWTTRLDALADNKVRATAEAGLSDDNFLSYFPPELVKHYRAVAKSMQSSAALIALSHLCVVSSVISGKSTVEIKPGYVHGTSLWGCGIDDSGTGKTHVGGAAHDATEHIQDLLDDEFERAEVEYQLNRKANPSLKPPKREFVAANGGTLQGLVDILQNNKGGYYRWQDEFVALFKAMNQFSGGKGDDEEKLLELFNGKRFVILNKGEQIVIKEPKLSIMGMTQPDVFLPLLREKTNNGNTGGNGFISRLIMLKPEIPKETDKAAAFEAFKSGGIAHNEWESFNHRFLKNLYTGKRRMKFVADPGDLEFLFNRFWDYAVEKKKASTPGLVKSELNKDRAKFCRIAATLMAMEIGLNKKISDTYGLDDLNKGDDKELVVVIPRRILEDAFGVYEHSLNTVKYLVRVMQGNAKAVPVDRSDKEQALREAIKDIEEGEIIPTRDLISGSLRTFKFKAYDLRNLLVQTGLANYHPTNPKQVLKA